MSSVKKSIETAESAQAAGAGTGEDAVREAQREAPPAWRRRATPT